MLANCGLPYYIGGTITEREKLTLQTPESFHARFRIDVRVCHEVVTIDREARLVTVLNHLTGTGYTESYDNLILSPGAKPIRPNIPGINNPRVFVLRNIPDTFRISDFIAGQQVRHAAVVGAGYIGVEMAENLRESGLDVTLIEMQDQVIAPLDYDMACDVQNHLREKGVNLILSNGVKAIAEQEHGQVSVFHWHEVDALPRDGSVTLLDVRNPEEFEIDAIAGFVNIPLNELRENLSQLDVEKPVYVTCQVGLRGYLASRILCQNGFKVLNLSGGNRLYQSVKLNK